MPTTLSNTFKITEIPMGEIHGGTESNKMFQEEKKRNLLNSCQIYISNPDILKEMDRTSEFEKFKEFLLNAVGYLNAQARKIKIEEITNPAEIQKQILNILSKNYQNKQLAELSKSPQYTKLSEQLQIIFDKLNNSDPIDDDFQKSISTTLVLLKQELSPNR